MKCANRPALIVKFCITASKAETQLEALGEEEGKWVKVETAGGTVGWMPKNYLSEDPSAQSELDEAVNTATLAATEQQLLREQMALLTSELSGAGIDIEMIKVTSEDDSVQIQVPRIIGNLAQLGSQNEELLTRNQLLEHELDLRAAEIDRLSDTQWKGYFMYGGAAVFFGIVLCLLLTNIKPKKRYSEWA